MPLQGGRRRTQDRRVRSTPRHRFCVVAQGASFPHHAGAESVTAVGRVMTDSHADVRMCGYAGQGAVACLSRTCPWGVAVKSGRVR